VRRAVGSLIQLHAGWEWRTLTMSDVRRAIADRRAFVAGHGVQAAAIIGGSNDGSLPVTAIGGTGRALRDLLEGLRAEAARPHLGLAFEEFCEELLDLRRCRELLQTLESRPGVDAEERLGVLRIEIDDVREVAGLLGGVLRGAREVVVVLLGRALPFAEPAADSDRELHRVLPQAGFSPDRRPPTLC